MSVEHGPICISLKNVGFTYAGLLSGQPVLDSVSAEIPVGDFVGIIGPNGGGKTTLLKLILGLAEPTTGTIEIFGHSAARAKAHFEIGYVPQHIAQVDFSFPATVREVVLSGRTRRCGLWRSFCEDDKRAASEMMSMVGIAELADRSLDQLSGGQRQRVFIARALAGEPKLLILDEPTVGVDSAAEDQLDRLLTKLNKENHMTIIMVSHDVDAIVSQVQHVLCVSKTLVCHVPAHHFEKQKYLHDVYGHNTQGVEHHH